MDKVRTPDGVVTSIDSVSKLPSELMDLALGHSVHHLKQLYQYMALGGITPVKPLGEADFDGVAVPTELF